MQYTDRQERLKERLALDGFEIVWLDELDSTNNLSSELALNGKENIVISEAQTNGLGRLGRSFNSAEGGIYESVAICLDEVFPEGEEPDLGKTLHFPLICALSAMRAVSEAVSESFGTDIIPDIKWPNDLVIKDKKISGILCKAAQCKGHWYIICGIGINVFNDLSKELEDAGRLADLINADDLDAEGQKEFLFELIAKLTGEIIRNIKMGIVEADRLLDEIEEHCITIGKYVEVPERNIKGIARQIGDDGALSIETDEGEFEVITSGDVVIYK